MFFKRFSVLLGILLLTSILLPAGNLQAARPEPLNIYFFSKQGCPYCAKVETLLESLQKTNANLNVHKFDLIKTPKEFTRFSLFAQAYGITTDAVPVLFIGERAIIGDQETAIETAIDFCQTQTCPDPQAYVTEKLKTLPPPETLPPGTTNRTIVGWIVLGVVVAGLGAIILIKIKRKK